MVSKAGATVSFFQQKGFVNLHSANIIPLFSTECSHLKKKNFFFSISRATRNCQRRYLSYNKRMKYSMKNMGKFRSNLISMWGKQKQVLFVWKGTSCFFLNVPFSLAFRLFFPLMYFPQPSPPFNSSFQLIILRLGVTYSMKPFFRPPAWAEWGAHSLCPYSPLYMPLCTF